MARAHRMRLNRKQLRMLPNPLSEGQFMSGRRDIDAVIPDKDTFTEESKKAQKKLQSLLRELLDEPAEAGRIISSQRKLIQKYATRLAGQSYEAMQGVPGIKGDAGALAQMYLGIDEDENGPGYVVEAEGVFDPDEADKVVAELAQEIEERRRSWAASAEAAPTPAPAPAPPSPPSPEVAERVAEAKELSKLSVKGLTAKVKEIKRRGPSAIPLLEAIGRLEGDKRKPRITVQREVSKAIEDLKDAAEAESARAGGSRTAAQVSSPGVVAMGAMLQGTTRSAEPEEGEGEDKGGDDSYMPGSGAASPEEKRFAFTATREKIRGAKQREEAREERVKGFAKEYMLKFRRPQSKSRNEDSNAPVLYAPPADVMAKIEEIMDADEYRKGPGRGAQSMPNQFQDVLVYILSKPFPVGRGRVIPAGSVEVYNKGTLVGTFGKKPMNTNIRKATIYAGTLVGLSFSASQPYTWRMSKRSRMHSRIYIAKQGDSGFSLLAPSLLEVMSEQRGSTPEDIELSLDAAQSAALGAQSNPRRSKSFLGTHFSPTRWGYQITSGPLRGNHYTIEEFGHGCKLAMLFDIME